MPEFTKKAATLALFSLVSMSAMSAQNPDSAGSPLPPAGNYGQQIPPAPSNSSQIVTNTEMHAVLETPLSTRTSKPGDRFMVTIIDPVRASNGLVAIPAGSRVEGEVAEAAVGTGQATLSGKGKLSLRFRDVLLPNGQMLAITAALVSVNSITATAAKSDEDTGGSTRSSPAFGPPLKGLAIGELAGGGYVIATKSKEIVLPAQTGVVIRLDQPLTATTGQRQPMP